MRVDLHMHSTFSDGLFTPTELVEKAVAKKLAAIAITDHDSVDGIHEAVDAGEKHGVEIVPGVELSCEFKGRDLHVLGYGVNPADATFQGMLRKFRETRHKRGLKIIEKLNALGVSIEPAEVLAKSNGALGRPHIAAVLVDRGVVSRTGLAFDKYIAEGGPAYVPKYKMTPDDAVRYIHGADGLAFMAHPGIFLEDMDEMRELIAHGFDGVEVYHPKHNKETVKRLLAMADEHGLLVSGGSDYHGFAGRDIPPGQQEVTYAMWEKIKQSLRDHK